MLSACGNGGTNKTAVMYRCNLSFEQLTRYLPFLQDQGLILKTEDGRYQLSDKGDETVKQIAAILDVLTELQDDNAESGATN
jgi:predicted transcriptional regulator